MRCVSTTLCNVGTLVYLDYLENYGIIRKNKPTRKSHHYRMHPVSRVLTASVAHRDFSQHLPPLPSPSPHVSRSFLKLWRSVTRARSKSPVWSIRCVWPFGISIAFLSGTLKGVRCTVPSSYRPQTSVGLARPFREIVYCTLELR